MKLYYNPLSPFSRKVLVTLYEKNIEFDGEIVNIFDPEEHAKYKEINPIGKVPFLVLEDRKIPESSIIMEYLDTNFSTGTKLLPEDPDLARRARFHDRIGDLYIIEPAGTLYFQKLLPEDKRDQAKIDKARSTIEMHLKIGEQMLKTPYVLGEQLTYADIAASSGLNFYLASGYNLNDFPVMKAWLDRMNERASWKRIHEESQPLLDKMHKA